MPDREKVIKRLEEISDYFFSVYHCSKDREEINKAKDRCDAVEDALALLKEQESVKPIVEQYALPLTNISVRFIKKYYCGVCKEEITGNNVYCHKCGRAVKWDE